MLSNKLQPRGLRPNVEIDTMLAGLNEYQNELLIDEFKQLIYIAASSEDVHMVDYYAKKIEQLRSQASRDSLD